MIQDISTTGIALLYLDSFKPSPEDIIEIKFSLDDRKRSRVHKKARIIHVNSEKKTLGAEFIESYNTNEDKNIYFYLSQN